MVVLDVAIESGTSCIPVGAIQEGAGKSVVLAVSPDFCNDAVNFHGRWVRV
jgi:hypothetical protein